MPASTGTTSPPETPSSAGGWVSGESAGELAKSYSGLLSFPSSLMCMTAFPRRGATHTMPHRSPRRKRETVTRRSQLCDDPANPASWGLERTGGVRIGCLGRTACDYVAPLAKRGRDRAAWWICVGWRGIRGAAARPAGVCGTVLDRDVARCVRRGSAARPPYRIAPVPFATADPSGQSGHA